MKIVMIGNNSGGMYNFRGDLIRELINRGHEVSIVVPDDPTDSKRYLIRELDAKIFFTPIDRRGKNPAKELCLIFKYFEILRKQKPDMVITYTIKPNLYGGFVCRVMKITHVANITGLGSVFEKSGFFQRIITIMLRTALKKSKVIFFENVGNRDYLVDKKIVTYENTYVLNGAGVNLEKFESLEYPKGEKINFLFMGRLMKEKGVDELLECVERLYKQGEYVYLDILGRSEEMYRERLEVGHEQGWLTYHGLQQDVLPYIANCHCFVLPSWHEGMANTNLECAASARPVITSNIHGCMEAVEDGVSGFLCERKNADSLYEVMKRFCKLDYENRKNMGLAGRKRMELIFDKKKVVQDTINHLGL